MERKLNGFIHKEKEKLKIRKLCVTQKGRHVGNHDVYGSKNVDSDMDDKQAWKEKG